MLDPKRVLDALQHSSALLIFPNIASTFLVEGYKIISGSMESTLLVGERILVSKLIHKVKSPNRGEVVLFVPPHDETKIFVKRIVALEGDTVETKGDILHVNGDAIDDSRYTQHIPSPFKRDFPPFFDPRHIPDGAAFDDYKFSLTQFHVRFPGGKPFVVPKGHILL